MFWLGIAIGVQLVVLAGLAVVVLSLARQVGILHERLSPAGLTRAHQGLKVGEQLPVLDLNNLDGGIVDIEAGRGALALLFVAIDCPICRSVLPAFEQALLDTKGKRAGFWVTDGMPAATVGTDQPGDYQGYAENHRIDPERFIVSQELGLALGIRQIPALVLLDDERQLQAKEVLNSPRQVQRLFSSH